VVATWLAVAATTLGLAACGGKERQDATEPAGDFAVSVTKSSFPNRQQLSHTTDLELAIRNVGDQTIPDLAITIYTGEQKAEQPFDIRLDQPNLADPNRPVWILENGYPKVLEPGITRAGLNRAPSAGAAAAQTDTFQFGPLAPGDEKDMIWRVTPVRGGTYPVNYEVAAGLQGKARAVTRDGGPVKGQFVVTIGTNPPATEVNSSGQVVPAD
jgi:hypothetical protein